MVSIDIVNHILLEAYRNYLNGIKTYKIQIPWNSYQSLYNEAINSLNEDGLINIESRTTSFFNVSLTPYGISCASEL
ncbi:hypothetical protein K8O96_07430 [Clostridium sporogenes]|uniref:Uncharacterized protein n=2 Tax=Clostridium TaxID=1485 RepID=A0A6M0T6H4_CLOBO|nr:hypothetical protein [Clostridium sporogenes]NFA61701.1 hypothetical protein [Clostridium botulinum]MDS1002197.1 hypothetical protein [Clostridium sporogenes]NFI73272.1 hypothetical protein [Clostridium sporogenes]NFL72852.1 hypothetical protein [Clostridium sporogenes]NFM25314.1 hypothetical protein [Clostridium sporogenes]